MNTCIYIRSAAAAIAILLLTQFLGCGCGNDGTFWFTDPPESFHTNDIERAQKEIPFTIILPKYLPDDIEPSPHMIEGPVKGTYSEDKVRITVTLPAKGEGDYWVHIEEFNWTVELIPPEDSISTYLNMTGIQVLECDMWSLVISPSGEQELVSGFGYAWNRDGVHFDVDVYGDDRDEARKIVESMIR